MKAPVPKEHEDQEALVKLLRTAISPQWRFTHLAAGEKRDIRTAMKLKRGGVTKGWPDFVFVHERGAVVWLELKRRKGGRFSPEQVEMRDFLMGGGNYFATNDITDAIIELRAIGILRASVSA